MNVQLPKEYKVRKKRHSNIYNMHNNMCSSTNNCSNNASIRRRNNKQKYSIQTNYK